MSKLDNRITKPIAVDSRGNHAIVDEAPDGSKAIPVVFVTKKAEGGFGYDGEIDPTTELDNDIKTPIARDAAGIAEVVDEDIDGKKAIPLVVYTKDDEGKLVPAELSTGNGGSGGGGVSPNHNHDDLYYRKSEIDGSINALASSLHKIKAKPDDEPDYLANKVDNVTLAVEGNELKVKSIDGLTVGIADISRWLSGTSENIQNQIDGINDSLVALTAGMRYLGKLETYADLQSIGNKENGNLAVVLADESRLGGRSMYVYSEDLGVWEFIGEFTFTNEFLALKDTPTSYAGADGKVVKVAGERLIFADVVYADIANKPQSTITQIDDAVQKKHEHSNLESLNRIGIDEQGRITVDGVPFIPTARKQQLYARRTGTEQELETGATCIFNTKYGGDIPYDATTGVFTLEAGKTYRVFVTASMKTTGFVILHLVDAETNTVTADSNRAIWMDVNLNSSSWHESSAGPLLAYVTPTVTKGYKIRVASQSGTAALRNNFSALEVQEI